MATAREPDEFRCLRCGATTLVTIPGTFVALTLGMKPHRDIAVPTCTCGNATWVLVGSTTEFYRWQVRPDVCRICNRSVAGTHAFTLRPRGPRPVPEPGTLQLETIIVHACPEHVEVLRSDGMMGFFLVE